MNHPRQWFGIAWIFLVVSALLGLILRAFHWLPDGTLSAGNLMQAHSHTAFLGWVFNAYFAFAVYLLTDRERRDNFARLFLVMQVAIVGMLFSFSMEGYGPVSITFSTVHLVAAVMFSLKIWKHHHRGTASPYLIAALTFMLVSGLGPLLLGPLAAMDLRDHPLYTLSIYFYLHFQYNGWFIFLPLALLLRIGEPQLNRHSDKRLRLALAALVVGTVLTFAHSTLWLQPPAALTVIAIAGALCVCSGLILLHRTFAEVYSGFRACGPLCRLLLLYAWINLWAKVLLQLVVPLPFLVEFAANRHSAIAYLHLIFLGVVLPVLMAIAIRTGWLARNRLTLAGTVLTISGSAGGNLLLAWHAALAQFGHSPALFPRDPIALMAAITVLGCLLILPCIRWGNNQ